MANKQRGEIKIKLCNEEYTMRPTFEAMCEMEDRLNISMPELVMQLHTATIKFKTVATIIWCGIHGCQDDGYTDEVKPTLNDIGESIRSHGITKIISDGIEDDSNPLVNFLSRGLMGDEQPGKQKPQDETSPPK
jgi:hypothetical protein